MKLPEMRFGDRISKSVQVKFGGLNHTQGAGDGELWDMMNLTSDHFPLLASRARRLTYLSLSDAGGLFSWDGLCWVDGDGLFYRGERVGGVAPGVKSFAAIGAFIIVLPDKVFYNTFSGEFGALESVWTGDEVTFTNGVLFDEAADANALQAEGVTWSEFFRAGDAVTISGCEDHPENNKTAVIRGMDGDRLFFYEFCFVLDGAGRDEPYSEAGELSVKRAVPDLLYLCENDNRLWGCDSTTIYASKLGDPFNWNVYDGLDTDSYAVDTGSAGPFTGAVSFLGYPVFFKEENIYKVYGSAPSNFEVMPSATLGVAQGCAGSLGIAGETLFYLSRVGVMAYSGGIPQPVGDVFGVERFSAAAAGSDGLKYYISMRGEDDEWQLYVYDTLRGLWHIEDYLHATHFAKWNGNLYCLDESGVIRILGIASDPPACESAEDEVEWRIEFADFTQGEPNKKGVSKVQIRLELDAFAHADIFMLFDSGGVWQRVGGVLASNVKRSYYLPIVPRRADHFRLCIEGEGGVRVQSLAIEFYKGSELQAH